MFDLGDPKFKLFGKTIPLPSDADEPSGDSIRSVTKLITQQRDAEDEAHKLQECERKSSDDSVLEDDSCPRIADEKSSEDQNEPISVNGTSDDEAQKDEESTQGEESKNSQDKGLKRPDKILPCPRCNSMDTKFCYYNNYNVHQPRHFCKSCQRYWTAGGTMRNVPVGAGRRKNKSSSSKYCHISISNALNGVHPHQQHQTGLKMNGTLLTFGSDSPHSESMASMMNLAEKKVKSGENGDDRSSGSSTVTTSGSVEGSSLKHQPPQNVNGFPGHHRVPFFPGFQLAYGWNPAVSMPPPPPGSAFPPIPFYPAPYWNGAAIPWNGPWVTPCQLTPKIPVLNSSSPTLGKHSRSEDAVNPSVDPEKRASSSRVLLPKTLRIDNPEEAAKSSIWNTLGIKKVESVGNGGFFNGLQSKGEEKKRKMETCPLLNANPAALARSISCQETA